MAHPLPLRLLFWSPGASAPPGPVVWIRELCGADELEVDGTDTATALRLLDRVLQSAPPVRSAQLSTADRDQVLAAVCSSTFGDRVDGTRECGRCGARFDLDFQLSSLAAAAGADAPPVPTDGVYEIDGARFRLPTGEDELAVAGLPVEQAERALLERCVLHGVADEERLLAEFGRVGPTLDLDLEAGCSECGASNPVAFSVQGWLLGRLAAERARLPRQIHKIARAYGWSLDQILSLPRSQRLALVALIDEEARGAPIRWRTA